MSVGLVVQHLDMHVRTDGERQDCCRRHMRLRRFGIQRRQEHFQLDRALRAVLHLVVDEGPGESKSSQCPHSWTVTRTL